MKKIAIYYRVSTDKQDLDSQKHAVEGYLDGLSIEGLQISIFEDIGISGNDHRRPGFQNMMKAAMRTEFDTIVVYRLDRFSRDASMAIRTLLELDHVGVGFVSVTQPVLNLGHDNPFRRTLLAAFAEIAEIERETIVARVKAGLDAARKRGVKLGPPSKITDEIRSQVMDLKRQGASYKEISKNTGISVGSISKILKLCKESNEH